MDSSPTSSAEMNQEDAAAADDNQLSHLGHVSAPSTSHPKVPITSPSSSFVHTNSQSNVEDDQNLQVVASQRSLEPESSGDKVGRWAETPLRPSNRGLGDIGSQNRQDITALGPRKSLSEPAYEEEPLLNEAPRVEEDNGAIATGPIGVSPSQQASPGEGIWPIFEGLKLLGLSRTNSMPPLGSRKGSHATNTKEAVTPKGWTVLKSRLLSSSLSSSIHPDGMKAEQHSTVMAPSTAAGVSLNDELMAGPLAPLILRMHFERDENDQRRVPVLLQHLKIGVSDSLFPTHGAQAVFRIECEYGDGTVRWVIYRELRDFLSLHTHYSLSFSIFRVLDIPEFPRTSIPFLSNLKKGGSGTGNPEFARQQREALENYLIGLIRAVTFHPEANRLCRWLEISALSIALAVKGGTQGKAGLLRVPSSFSGRKQKQPYKWWLVRESYLVSVLDPASTQIDDVFMLDADFTIQRSKRVYRQGLNLLHIANTDREAVGSKDQNDEDTTRWLPQSPLEAEKQNARVIYPTEKEQTREGNPDSGDEGSNHSVQENDAERATETATTKSRSSIRKFFSVSRHGRNDDQQRKSDKENNATNVNKPNFGEKENVSDPEEESRQQSDSHRSLGIDENTMEADIMARQMGAIRGHSNEEDAHSSHESSSDDDTYSTAREVGAPDDEERKTKDVNQHTFILRNTQRNIKLVAKNERQMLQFIASMERMMVQSQWTGLNRFGSFAPIRPNVSAQLLIDGRDYFWDLSRAIMQAKERIYIHDWWISPEIYLRRPGQEAYRLDRLLKRKAEEGVKIYIIIYQEVSNRMTPVDSNYTRRQLMGLHPNILVQRSPSHFTSGTYYWAHSEKLCVVDQMTAFMGGIDLCFGRWDTPHHDLVDDEGGEGGHRTWPGKDYSNTRVINFNSLNKLDEDMYDRTKVARMPWHDIGLQLIGQPARDLCRHFVQRWNYILRNKTRSRAMPFLLPAPEFNVEELKEQGLTGTCEVQICRSAGPWSLGTPTHIEHSIQNAYLKAIQLSEHFVYIENQFFITSTFINEFQVENNIGDALVDRVVRAHREGTAWRAIIIIPLLPGFALPIDHNDASSIRIIVELQNRSICRGPNSIFSRLRQEGIDPHDYITFFSLRGWGKLGGKTLTTEQVHVHAKIMIVDDRLAIIGSANINDRSMRGDRDSEIACVIRDTDMIDSTMAGKPFQVGRFAHNMRIRLMREHLGIDEGATYEEDLMAYQATKKADDVKTWELDYEQVERKAEEIPNVKNRATGDRNLVGGPGSTAQDEKESTLATDGSLQPGLAPSEIPILEGKVGADYLPNEIQSSEDRRFVNAINEGDNKRSPGAQHAGAEDGTGSSAMFGDAVDTVLSAATAYFPPNDQTAQEGALEAERSAPEARKQTPTFNAGAKPYPFATPKVKINPHGFADPLDPSCYIDTWVATAVHNTEIYREVFHCTPDDSITTWKQYKEFIQFQDRLNRPAKGAPVGAPHIARLPSEGGTAGEDAGGLPNPSPEGRIGLDTSRLSGKGAGSHSKFSSSGGGGYSRPAPTSGGSQRRNGEQRPSDGEPRRPTKFDEPLAQWERDEFETLLEGVQGHLVVFPTRFLEGESTANNILSNSDRLLPIPIFC